MIKLPFRPLNLPVANLDIRDDNSILFVFDIVRKKLVKLEPEEWVRQHLIHYLVYHLNYPLSLFQVEVPVNVNSLNQRADIIVLDPNGAPFLLAECKSYSVSMSSDVLHQAIRYNTHFSASYIVLSNGLEHHCLERNPKSGMLKALEAFPEYVKNS